MSTAAPEPKANMGQPVPRYDAVAKVTGKAEYAADMPLSRPAYAYLVTSSIAKGRIDGFDLAAAKRVRGVIDIVTYENADTLKQAKLPCGRLRQSSFSSRPSGSFVHGGMSVRRSSFTGPAPPGAGCGQQHVTGSSDRYRVWLP